MKLATKYSTVDGNKTSDKFYDVVGEQVTINKEHVHRQYFKDIHTTIFNEVSVTHYRSGIPWEILLALRGAEALPISEKAFFNGIIETLAAEIVQTWNSKKHHLIQHSSGWDSRIMGAIIKRLHRELGDDWLGDTAFVSWGCEAEAARKIVADEGWDPNMFVGLQKDSAYFDAGLNFSTAWRSLNGSSVYPINNPYWAARLLQERGVIPQDIEKTQIYAASWFNEMFKAIMTPRGDFENGFLKTYYYCLNGVHTAAIDFEFIQPLYNPQTISHFIKHQVHLQGSHEDVRRRLVAHLDKKLLRVPRCGPAAVGVPSHIFNRVMVDYKNSWYGKNIVQNPPDVNNIMRMSSWWGYWSAASMIEHLLNEGVSVS